MLSGLSDKLLSWDIIDHAPHEVWRTREGRRTLERRLGQLVKTGKNDVGSLGENVDEV